MWSLIISTSLFTCSLVLECSKPCTCLRFYSLPFWWCPYNWIQQLTGWISDCRPLWITVSIFRYRLSLWLPFVWIACLHIKMLPVSVNAVFLDNQSNLSSQALWLSSSRGPVFIFRGCLAYRPQYNLLWRELCKKSSKHIWVSTRINIYEKSASFLCVLVSLFLAAVVFGSNKSTALNCLHII